MPRFLSHDVTLEPTNPLNPPITYPDVPHVQAVEVTDQQAQLEAFYTETPEIPIKAQAAHLLTLFESPHPYHGLIGRGIIYQRRPSGFHPVAGQPRGDDSGEREPTTLERRDYADDYRRGLRFMFNPTAFDMNYEVNTSVLDPTQQSAEELAGSFFPTGRTFSLQLLFDRQLEVAKALPGFLSQAIEPIRPLYEVGVYEDIRGFERLMGIKRPNDFAVLYTPVNVLLSTSLTGGINTGFGLAAPAFPVIRAVLVSASVQITDWATPGFVPTRCVIQMQFQHQYSPPSDGITGLTGGYISGPGSGVGPGDSPIIPGGAQP